MFFVGRTKEIKLLYTSLARGENSILAGRFGMGRTSLMRHMAESFKDRWRFVFCDFSKTPADICSRLTRELYPAYGAKLGSAPIKFKTAKFEILNRPMEDPRQHVLVLDNIEKLSRQKIALLQYLSFEKRFLYVAVTAGFLPKDQYQQLKVVLLASCRITLGHMSLTSAGEFFEYYSKKYFFNWSEEYIKHLSQRTKGYPLSMKEIITEARKKRTV